MRIAFIYDAVYPYVKGGVEKRVHELAVRLSSRGHDVHVVGMKYWDGPDSITSGGVVLHGVCPAEPLYAGGRRRIFEAFSFGTRLIPFLAREEFDITDCQQFPYLPCFPVKLATLLKKKRFVITWHEVWGEYWYEYLGWAGSIGKGIEWLVSLLTPHIISVSVSTAENLRHLGVRQDIRCIPNGIDLKHLESVPPHSEETDLIFVGRLIREKHVDVLVRAFSLLCHDNPRLTLTLLGSGPEEEAIRSLVRDLSLSGRVRLLPFSDSHDEVVGRMKASHVFVIPSTREGFGIVALEALACGLPVITVDHPRNAIRELITGETGFLCPLSEKALADTIRTALDRYPEMQAACRRSVECFDWDVIVDRLEEYYRSVMTGPD